MVLPGVDVQPATAFPFLRGRPQRRRCAFFVLRFFGVLRRMLGGEDVGGDLVSAVVHGAAAFALLMGDCPIMFRVLEPNYYTNRI